MFRKYRDYRDYFEHQKSKLDHKTPLKLWKNAWRRYEEQFKPLFELKPFKEDQKLENIFADIIVAKEDIKKGRVYSQEDILAEFA